MWKKISGIGLLFILLPIASSARSPRPRYDAPQKLFLSHEGFTGDSYRVEWDAKTWQLCYFYNPETFTFYDGKLSRNTVKECEPVSRWTWEAFWKDLEQAGVWSWKKNYTTVAEPDSARWIVKIAWEGKTVESEGIDAYPLETQFKMYQEAVRKLLGGKKFR